MDEIEVGMVDEIVNAHISFQDQFPRKKEDRTREKQACSFTNKHVSIAHIILPHL